MFRNQGCLTVCSVTCLITPFLIDGSCICQPSKKPARWQALLTPNQVPTSISPFPSSQILQLHLSALLTYLDIYSSCRVSVTPCSPEVSVLRFKLPKPCKWKEETKLIIRRLLGGLEIGGLLKVEVIEGPTHMVGLFCKAWSSQLGTLFLETSGETEDVLCFCFGSSRLHFFFFSQFIRF